MVKWGESLNPSDATTAASMSAEDAVTEKLKQLECPM